MEWIANIQPPHAYRDTLRHRFPEWRGRTEFDYYRWQFQTRLAPNWSRLNHRTRWRLMPGSQAARERLAALYERIPWEDRQAARSLVDEAQRAANREAAIPLWERALQLSPYEAGALRGLDDVYRWRRPEAHELSERVALLRDADDFLTVADVAPYGVPVGRWRPHQMRYEGAELEWDASGPIGGAGTYDITMLYTDGRTAARIAWVALLEDGREIARDTHAGWSGTRKDGITYTLALPVHRPGARYAIRARLSGGNATDSNGLVLLRRR